MSEQQAGLRWAFSYIAACQRGKAGYEGAYQCRYEDQQERRTAERKDLRHFLSQDVLVLHIDPVSKDAP